MSSNSQDGYEDERFQNVVSPNFHCSICLNVLKAPKMCRNNQHLFCTHCITRHLTNSPTCPECMEELTIQTLNLAPRVLLNYLSELNINCDYYSRGCREFTQLGNLNTHVLNCGFGPVRCSNYGCVVEINKRDRVHHERAVCEFRKVQCHDCSEIRKDGDELKQKQAEMKQNQAELKENQAELKENQAEMKENLAELEANQAELKENQAEMKENLAELEANQAKLKENQAEMKENLAELKANQIELKENQAEMKENLAELKANQIELKEQLAQLPSLKEDIVKEVRAVMDEVLKHANAAQAVQPPLHVKSASKQDIVMIGGRTTNGKIVGSVESFSWKKKAWAQLPSIKEPRSMASSFVYENHVMVAGGLTGCSATDSIEMAKTDEEPLQWITCPAKLPAKLRSHTTVVYDYENRLILIGGYNWAEHSHSNAIYEVRLIPPYSTKLLRRMPQPRKHHGTELVNNKIFILGGTTSFASEDATDSVIVYDVVKNECKQMGPLLYAVWGMATVSWRNKVILIGGCNTNDQVLNNVITYDIETGESERLPSMKCKRRGCSAVVTGDVMVVMGGWNEDQKYLNSVECFSFSSNSWKELPAMMEARQYATAVVN